MSTATPNTTALAQSALCEITEISQVLREFIDKHDETGGVVCVARGMLARVQSLSEAVSLILDGGDTSSPEEQRRLFELIECRRAEREEQAAGAAP